MARDAYEREVVRLQKKAYAMQIRNFLHGRRAVVVFEGWDAAGKGGAIKRPPPSWTREATRSGPSPRRATRRRGSTGCGAAPWTLVPASDKRFARLEVLRETIRLLG